jgi:two-component system, NarL family, nitrate/nitrite response regulator NarL
MMGPKPIQIGLHEKPTALIISEVCFLRESLAEILTRAGITICGQSETLPLALAIAQAQRPELVLLDVAFPCGVAAAMRLADELPGTRIIALAIAETEENVLTWAQAGIAGYVPNTASVEALVLLIEQIRRGEQPCPTRIVGSLLRRIGASERVGKQSPPVSAPLTPREREISQLISTGLSNKDIARRLGISLGTTKSHVHNLLGKLSLQRRADIMLRMNAGR